MSTQTITLMPRQEAIDCSYDQSPLSSSSDESVSSQASYDSVSTNTSYGSEDGNTYQESIPPPYTQFNKARTWGCEDVGKLESARLNFQHQLQRSQTLPTVQPVQQRRSSTLSAHGPPSLVRDTQRKDQFVNNLVESAVSMVEEFWPLATCDLHSLGLREYIQEILKRTKTSFSTLQVALFYILLVKPHIPCVDFTQEQPRDVSSLRGFQCGRRMFLSAIILASKYLQDRNYSSKAWRKITGLAVEEINANETNFLQAIQWRLHIPLTKFEKWQEILLTFSNPSMATRWRQVVKILRPELDNVPPVAAQPIDTAIPHGSGPSSPVLLSPMPLVTGYPTPASSPRRFNSPPSVLAGSPQTGYPVAPLAPRIARLATPRFNENVSPSGQTPAVGFSKMNSMRGAMAMAQTYANARCFQDFQTTRPCSLASTSPESMISDHSSLPSRSSSISSTSSLPLVPDATRLAHYAQLNALKQFSLANGALSSSPEDIVIECASSPLPTDFEYSASRKRPRGTSVDGFPVSPATVTSRVDSTLQQRVRGLLSATSRAQPSVLSKIDTSVGGVTVTQSMSHTMGLAIPAVKRMRSSGLRQENLDVWIPEGGPGMWRGMI